MIRVLIAEDSSLVASILREMLRQDPEIEVVGWARNGEEAVELRNSLEPDVITMDLNMPVMGGLDAIETLALTRPVPILVVSQLIEDARSDVAFEALRRGAIDIMGKPRGDPARGFSLMKNELIARVKNVSRVRPFPRIKTPADGMKPMPFLGLQGGQKLVAIGASTGGPAALARILSDLPQDFSSPLVIVQHIARDFINGLAEWLGHESHLSVKIAAPGNCLSPRTAFLAPDDCHLTIGGDKALLLTNDPAVNGHRPSINRLMESAARFGKKTVGVLLTGMGSDGAEGLKKIRMAGGTTIVQDESTSLVFGMPQQAIRQGAAMVISPLADIAKEIVNATLSD